MSRYILLLIINLHFFSYTVWAGSIIKGIYGVPSISSLNPDTYESNFKKGEVKAVFVPEDKATIQWYKKAGYDVYISANAFGGKEEWKKYPDSRPVEHNGKLLGSEPDDKGYGGICPTHEKIRSERLKYIEDLVSPDRGLVGIDGIWLDFIRYPGLWEVKEPNIPDTCYCQRCIDKFRVDKRINIPAGIKGADASLWIKKNCLYEWMIWKKEQIYSFVVQVKQIIKKSGKQIKLGLFLVPWTKGEKQDAISFKIAQDAFELSKIADVISPMVYHKMCGKEESWVGYMTKYYKETAKCEVWPIVQSVDIDKEGFYKAAISAAQADADGILVYAYEGMKPDFWDKLRSVNKSQNLIINSGFNNLKGKDLPEGWNIEQKNVKNADKSLFYIKSSDKFVLQSQNFFSKKPANVIGMTADRNKSGIWKSKIIDGKPGEKYIFDAYFYRDKWNNGQYPVISIWGKDYIIDTNLMAKTFQPVRIHLRCPKEFNDNVFKFINNDAGMTYWLFQPKLVPETEFPISGQSEGINSSSFYKDFFPIGVYGVNKDNLQKIKELAINTVLIGGEGENLKQLVQKCHELGLKYVISVPRDTDRLPLFLNEIKPYVMSENLAFYVNDEPEIWSFPVNNAEDINRVIKTEFPLASTCMAIVRPQVCQNYKNASDYFMLDQYPVPSMPMTWLSDSIDQAGKDVGNDRLLSIIQAFGCEKYKDVGWPRLPTWQEMDCLSFLSIIHGSRGILFYSFDEIGQTVEGRQALGRVIGRLNQVYPWLKEKNIDQTVKINMISKYRYDPQGRPSIHCGMKRNGDKLLLMAVNTIQTYVEAEIKSNEFKKYGSLMAKELFSGLSYYINDGSVTAKFDPYETKVFEVRNED